MAGLQGFNELIHDLPAGVWVAISESQHSVVAFGDDIRRVAEEAHEKGEQQPLMMKVPDPAATFLL